MGLETVIFFKTREGGIPQLSDELPYDCTIFPATDVRCPGATHEVRQHWRFYGPTYNRGPWPSIAAVLMGLYASSEVECVWYFCDTDEAPEPFGIERVLEFSAHYMANKT